MLEASAGNIQENQFPCFSKSVNNGHSRKFSLASKQGKKPYETHLFPSLATSKCSQNL